MTRRFRRGAETVTALDVTLDVHADELSVVVGPSGSGKTTLLSIVAGFERVDSGRLTPRLPTDRPAAVRHWRRVAFVPQGLGLLDEFTVRENIDIPARLGGAAAPPDREWSTEQIMDRLGSPTWPTGIRR